MLRGVEPAPDGAIDFARHLRAGRHRRSGRDRTRCGATPAVRPSQLPGIILGKELARELDVQPGDPVNVVSPVAIPTAIGPVPKRASASSSSASSRPACSSTTARSRTSDLADAQRFFDLGDAVTGIEVRTADLDHADAVAAAIARHARLRASGARLEGDQSQPVLRASSWRRPSTSSCCC